MKKKNVAPDIWGPDYWPTKVWLDHAAMLDGTVPSPVDTPTPAPHPNEVATRQAVEAGLYPTVIDDDGLEVNPLDVVGARSVELAD